MSTRKSPRPEKKPPAKPPTPPTIDIDAMLMIGDERVHIDCAEDDNVTFMAEQID